MKGARYLPALADELRRLGIPFTLEIYGKGPLQAMLESEIAKRGLQQQVSLRGSRDSLTEWVPLLKRHTDLFDCPHPQGDRSSTYPEVMSCGVPIVGFDRGLRRHRHSEGGWLVPSKTRRLSRPRSPGCTRIAKRSPPLRGARASLRWRTPSRPPSHSARNTSSGRAGYLTT